MLGQYGLLGLNKMKNGNKNAYPGGETRYLNGLKYPQHGLTKRELFAAMVLQGICSKREYHECNIEIHADQAVSAADALLKALEKTE